MLLRPRNKKQHLCQAGEEDDLLGVHLAVQAALGGGRHAREVRELHGHEQDDVHQCPGEAAIDIAIAQHVVGDPRHRGVEVRGDADNQEVNDDADDEHAQEGLELGQDLHAVNGDEHEQDDAAYQCKVIRNAQVLAGDLGGARQAGANVDREHDKGQDVEQRDEDLIVRIGNLTHPAREVVRLGDTGQFHAPVEHPEFEAHGQKHRDEANPSESNEIIHVVVAAGSTTAHLSAEPYPNDA